MRKLFRLEYLLRIVVVLCLPLQTSATDLAMYTTAKIQVRMIACESPRPIICQQSSAPVCGVFTKTKAMQTFRNACLACKNTEIKGYEMGKCKGRV